MRIMRLSPRMAALGLLLFTGLTSAVSLSDFAPRLSGLSGSCKNAYSTTIPGCTVSDFTNSQKTCSKACLAGLVQINALVTNECADADVPETSIIGLFQLGKGIQVLCNVAVVTTTTGQALGGPATMGPTESIGQSTMVLSSTVPVTTGLFTDTSVPIKPSTTKFGTSSVKTTMVTSQTPASSNGILVDTSAATKGTSTTASISTKTSGSPGQAQSQKSGGDSSGGGSPFDNTNNSGAAGLRAFSHFFGGILAAIMLGGYLALY